ncbi:MULTISPECIES: hypothetical protein [unclassified Streptomyces]|uniref:hypothetical protein n=1 Tax=unclassified Streptomyces TaxID=2593676 RepID=UPI0005AA27A3|nr:MULTISPECIES: hypothetical protein [unclassified Streptomyces]ODA70524.1 hypothetical protein APS67_005258 [Streptomyces sp. AVP053U2]
MSDQNMADDVHQPTGGNEEQEDASPLDLQNAVGERTYDDMLDEGYSPPEGPLGVTKTGTTASEQYEGESLDEKIRQEVPDVGGPAGDGTGERPDEGTRADGTGEPVADDRGVDAGGT